MFNDFLKEYNNMFVNLHSKTNRKDAFSSSNELVNLDIRRLIYLGSVRLKRLDKDSHFIKLLTNATKSRLSAAALLLLGSFKMTNPLFIEVVM